MCVVLSFPHLLLYRYKRLQETLIDLLSWSDKENGFLEQRNSRSREARNCYRNKKSRDTSGRSSIRFFASKILLYLWSVHINQTSLNEADNKMSPLFFSFRSSSSLLRLMESVLFLGLSLFLHSFLCDTYLLLTMLDLLVMFLSFIHSRDRGWMWEARGKKRKFDEGRTFFLSASSDSCDSSVSTVSSGSLFFASSFLVLFFLLCHVLFPLFISFLDELTHQSLDWIDKCTVMSP